MNNDTHTPASLSKKERLKSRKTISRLFTLNQSILLYPYKFVWEIEQHDSPFEIEVGVSVAKRNFKRAVDRNLLKRRMREAFRKNKTIIISPLSSYNIKLSFMVIYVAKDFVTYEEMESRMKKILYNFSKKVETRIDFQQKV